MKKTIALLLAMIFVIGLLAACTPSNTAQDPVQTDDPNAGTPAETTTPDRRSCNRAHGRG